MFDKHEKACQEQNAPAYFAAASVTEEYFFIKLIHVRISNN
jgi:hypothetical protein